MSQENVEIARKSMEAFNRRDKDAYLALLDPEVEFHPDPKWPESGTMRGPEAVWAFAASFAEAWQQRDFEMVEFIDPGDDKLVARFVLPVQGKASGLHDVLDQWSVLVFRRGRILSQHWFTSRADALEAAGLQE